MGQLFFKKPLQIAIREGRKRTTIRRWDKPRVKAGKAAYALGVGWLQIQSVEPIDLAQLTHEDAVADGFTSRDALFDALSALYPDTCEDGRSWFRVSFQLAELEPTHSAQSHLKASAAIDPRQMMFEYSGKGKE